MPASTPVPVLKVTPPGSVPVRAKVGAGKPLPVTWKLPDTPVSNEVLSRLVTAGAWLTVSVKACAAGLPTPLLALMVKA